MSEPGGGGQFEFESAVARGCHKLTFLPYLTPFPPIGTLMAKNSRNALFRRVLLGF
jgi:hypothetical protein